MTDTTRRVLLVSGWGAAAFALLFAWQQARAARQLQDDLAGARRAAAPAAGDAALTTRPAASPAVPAVTGNPGAEAARLKLRVAELETQLRDLARDNSRLAARAGDRGEAGGPPDPGRRGPGGRGFPDFASFTPEQQAEFRQRMQEMTTRAQQTLQDQSAFVGGLDTSGMTEEQRGDHDKLVALLAESEQIMAQLQQDPPPDEAGPLRRQLWQNMGEARDLLESERQAALVALGKSLNYPEPQAQQFAAYVQHVIDMTSLPRMGGGRGGRPGGSAEGGATPAPGAAP